jgi:hypothetical protein
MLERPRCVAPQASREATTRGHHYVQGTLPTLPPLDGHASRVELSSMPSPALKFYPITPLSGRPRPTAQALFKRGRALSAPATPLSDLSVYSQPSPLVRRKRVRFDVPAGSDSSLDISLAHIRNSSLVETSPDLSNASLDDGASYSSADAAPPFIPPLDFGRAEPSFIEVPWVRGPSIPADGNFATMQAPTPTE